MGVAVKQDWIDAARGEGWEDRPRKWSSVRSYLAVLRSKLIGSRVKG